MVALMGGETIIAGMQPSVAITATELGVSLGRTRTALTVDRALDMAASTQNHSKSPHS
jgi:rsbT antagonist protein RsbS